LHARPTGMTFAASEFIQALKQRIELPTAIVDD
jgi:hypothetical protein